MEINKLDNILDIAKKDKRIKAIYMNGSRCNPNVKFDEFQDYDLVFVVENVGDFINDMSLVESFGEISYFQCPEQGAFILGKKVNLDECYGWLVQYKEGHRIDLHVVSVDYALRTISEDSLTQVVYDVQNILPSLSIASEKSYFIKRPSEKEFQISCNEFWWCLNGVAKAIWRKEVLATLAIVDEILRPELLKILCSLVASKYEYKINLGKSAKYLAKYIDKSIYECYLNTYNDSNHIVESILILIDLFDNTASKLANELGYSYNKTEAKNSSLYFMDVLSKCDN